MNDIKELLENPVIGFTLMVLLAIIGVIIVESVKFLFYLFMRKVFKVERYKGREGWRSIE